MPVQQIAPPTIIEIARELASYEEQYGITTAKFLEEDCRIPEIDEDDAVEWFYRVEQLRVLQEVDCMRPYSRVERGVSLKNHDSVMDCLAA